MRTECPVFLRCCFCFPLRYGLLVWGYLKLISAVLLLVVFSVTLRRLILLQTLYEIPIRYGDFILVCVLIFVVIVDIILNAVFITGAHKKNVKLLKAYCIYCMVVWGVLAVLGTISTGILMYALSKFFNEFTIYLTLSNLSILFLYLITETYVILLVRSEIIKLNNSSQFRFVNNAAEAECTVKLDDSCITEILYEGSMMEENDDYDTKPCVVNGTCGSKMCCKNELNNGNIV